MECRPEFEPGTCIFSRRRLPQLNRFARYSDWSSAVPANVWTHVAVTFDGTQAVFYINGSATGCTGGCAWQNDPVFAPDYTPAEITIGGLQAGGSGQNFQGYLDEVGLFTHALTGSEIQERLTAKPTTTFNRQLCPAWRSH